MTKRKKKLNNVRFNVLRARWVVELKRFFFSLVLNVICACATSSILPLSLLQTYVHSVWENIHLDQRRKKYPERFLMSGDKKDPLTSTPSELAVVGGPGGVQVLQGPADDIGFRDVPLVVAHRPPLPHVEDLDVPLVRRPAPDQPQGPFPDIAGLPGPVAASARSRLGKSHQE